MNPQATALFHSDRGFIEASNEPKLIYASLIAIRAIEKHDIEGKYDRLADFIIVTTPEHPCRIEQLGIKNAADWILQYD